MLLNGLSFINISKLIKINLTLVSGENNKYEDSSSISLIISVILKLIN